MSLSISGLGSFDPTALFEKMFKKIDNDGDGTISKTEFESAVSTMAKDQNLSTSEADALFSKLDANGDGTVSESEMMNALKSAAEQRRAHMPPPPPDDDQNDQSASLTDDQKKTVDSVLAKYDSSNLSSDDVKAINQAISDAGIAFGKALGDEIESQGFSIQKMMELAGPPQNSATNAADETDGRNVMFSDLLKSLQSSDSSTSASTTSVNDLFSNLVASLKSGNYSDEDEISALISNFLQELKSGSLYGENGSLNVSASSTSSLFATNA